MTRASAINSPPDTVRITGLRLVTRVGVPVEERAEPQGVEADISMEPLSGTLSGTGDALVNTIDYHAVSQAVRRLAASGQRRLIEKLAEDIANGILSDFAVRQITVEIRKFVLPGSESVSVRLTRRRAGESEG